MPGADACRDRARLPGRGLAPRNGPPATRQSRAIARWRRSDSPRRIIDIPGAEPSRPEALPCVLIAGVLMRLRPSQLSQAISIMLFW
jgi:hypothetical protein